jgi:hypothetical protein
MSDIKRFEGTVTKAFENKGYGFITGLDNIQRFFLRTHLRHHEEGKRCPLPLPGAKVRFAEALVNTVNPNTDQKRRDMAIDIEVL